jgi:putative ABC transport system permease protein
MIFMIPLTYNFRNLAVRKTTTAAAAFGLAFVVFVFGSVMMLENGIRKTLGRSAATDVAVVLRKGANAELESAVEESTVNLVLNDTALPEPARGPRGVAEIVVAILLEKIGTDAATNLSNVTIRGVQDNGLEFRPTARILAGRAPRPGTDEVMVGKAIRGRFAGLDLQQSFELKKNRRVTVVGVFEDGGSSYESEVWADIGTVRATFHREGYVSALRARIDPSRFDAFKTSVESNRQLNMRVLKEADYYEKLAEGSALFIQAMGTVVAIFFSFGAMLGAMITMFATVANRQREIGTLRALGFSRKSILLSFVIESVMLALVGGVIGAAGALGMGFVRFSMVNFASFSEIVFTFEPTPAILLRALVFAAVMGVLGGLLPAIRAARISPVDAMRA